MGTIVVELTNHCNLKCRHCFQVRHSANGHLDRKVVDILLRDAGAYGFDRFSFTGGEPTLHPEFMEIIGAVRDAGYKYGFVSNGWNFTALYDMLTRYADRLTGITFSLDGACEESHDRARGRGSFRRLMSAVSICFMRQIPFTFNSLMTSDNRDKLKETAELVQKLGGRGIRFGHLMPTPHMAETKQELSPEEKKEVEAHILQFRCALDIPVLISPGHYTTDLFPCDPLKRQEINIDWKGNVTLCCHLSGQGDGAENQDIAGNLGFMSFPEAYVRLAELHGKFRQAKNEHFAGCAVSDTDYFPCWYCMNYFRKINWLREFPGNSWHNAIWANTN